jgi:hypothetical protein
MHQRGANGAAGAGAHRLPSAHDTGAAAAPQTAPAVAHTGGPALGVPPAGAHAPAEAWGASCSKWDPDTDAHVPAVSMTDCIDDEHDVHP